MKEVLRHCDAIAIRVSRPAVGERLYPPGKSDRVWLAAKKVEIVLAHKEVRVVDWVRAIGILVVQDIYSRSGLGAERCAGRIVQTDAKMLGTFRVGVVNDRHIERF